MNEPSHFVSGFRIAAEAVDSEILEIINVELVRYRKRVAGATSLTRVADMAIEILERYDSDDSIGPSEKRPLLVGLMNAVCEYRLNTEKKRTTCSKLEQLFPAYGPEIERIYTLLDPALNTRRTVCGFDPIEQLGVGGHGQVFSVKDDFNHVHAIKFAIIDSPEASLLENERQVVSQLGSLPDRFLDRIPKYFRLAGDSRHVGLVMELLDGVNLQSHIRSRAVNWRSVRAMAMPLLDLIFEIHLLGFLHLDLKPANIFLRKVDEGTAGALSKPVLIDFGLAISLNDGNRAAEHPRSIGETRAFASPEQIAGDAVGYQSDIYSLGCTLGYALVRISPDDRTKFVEGIREYAIENPGSKTLVSAILKAVEQKPDDRFLDVAEFRNAIWPSQAPESLRRKKILRQSCLLVALASFVFVALLLSRRSDNGPPTWIDRLEVEHGVDLQNYGHGEFRFRPDFVEYERANFYKGGTLMVSTAPELGPFLNALEARIGDGPWVGGISVGDNGVSYALSSDQIVDGQAISLRFDSMPGAGIGQIYGQRITLAMDLNSIRDRQIAEWRDNRRQFEKNLGVLGYAFEYKDGWQATDYLLDQAWEIKDVVLYKESSRQSQPISLRDLYLQTGAYAQQTNTRDQIATLCKCMPDEFKKAVVLNFAIQYRGDPPFWKEEFWENSKIHTLDRALWTGEAPRLVKGGTEYFLPDSIDKKNKIASGMLRGRKAGAWDFTDEFIDQYSSLVAEIYFTTSVFGEPEEPQIQLATPTDIPTTPSNWDLPREIYLRGQYDVTCCYARIVFLDGTSSDFVRLRMDRDTEYFDQRRWVAITYDAPEVISKDLDIGEQLRYLKSRELQRINYGK